MVDGRYFVSRPERLVRKDSDSEVDLGRQNWECDVKRTRH